MKEENLERRMYFFVPYQLTGIQQGIQCGHAAIEYMMKFWKELDCIDFRENWKTWVILNGGTTNSRIDQTTGLTYGTLNQIHEDLWLHSVNHALFYEPDLENALTSVCFILDERVFNKTLYPNMMDWVLDIKMYPTTLMEMPKMNENMLRRLPKEKYIELYPEYYQEWVEFVGGEKNVFLRNLIDGKRLA